VRNAYKGDIVREIYKPTEFICITDGEEKEPEKDKYYVIEDIKPYFDGKHIIEVSSVRFLEGA
jgi:hypothetical protein